MSQILRELTILKTQVVCIDGNRQGWMPATAILNTSQLLSAFRAVTASYALNCTDLHQLSSCICGHWQATDLYSTLGQRIDRTTSS